MNWQVMEHNICEPINGLITFKMPTDHDPPLIRVMTKPHMNTFSIYGSIYVEQKGNLGQHTYEWIACKHI